MAEPITENDDDIEVIEVAELPKPGEAPAAAAEPEAEDDDAPAEEEDARLVADDDDEDDATDAGTPAHKKRVKRRQIQKQARDRTLAELAELRAFKQSAEARFASLETNVLTQNETQVDERLSKTREDISLADRIMAKALEAGNGEDFVAAQNMRDAAKATEFELLRAKGGFGEKKTAAPDTRVVSLANEWKTSNSNWYGSNPTATAVANQIDAQVATDGYDPAKPAYWQELSRRLNEHPLWAQPATTTTKKKTPPPQGQSREHAPPTTRQGEVYVTPERKAALIEKGVWDDPVERKRYLKAFATYDREQAEQSR